MAKSNSRFYISLSLRVAAVLTATSGVLLSYFWPTGYMVKWRTFLYFTAQSNVGITAVLLWGFVLDIMRAKGKQVNYEAYFVAKHIFTLAMTVTFLIFYFLIFGGFLVAKSQSDVYGLAHLVLLPSNWTVHLLAPILVFCDYLFFDKKFSTSRKKVCWLSLIFPLAYVAFILVCSLSGMYFTEEQAIVPYFFMDYGAYGWFDVSSKG